MFDRVFTAILLLIFAIVVVALLVVGLMEVFGVHGQKKAAETQILFRSADTSNASAAFVSRQTT